MPPASPLCSLLEKHSSNQRKDGPADGYYPTIAPISLTVPLHGLHRRNARKSSIELVAGEQHELSAITAQIGFN